MFDQIEGERTARTRKPIAVALSFAGQVVLLGLTVLFPLLHPEAITTGRLTQVVPLLRPWARRRSERNRVAGTHATAKPGVPVFTGHVFREPARVPQIAQLEDGPVAGIPPAGMRTYGSPDGVFGAIPASVIPPQPKAAPPQPAEGQAAKADPPRVRIGGSVQAARLLRQVTPKYPALARQARVSGVVRLEAVINRNGTIESLHVISGHPLLVPAALEAVTQWVYRLTILNGAPVEVLTQIEVHFRLGE
jgi:protein TonB